jgi:mono/diheme cytochrome c family protein
MTTAALALHRGFAAALVLMLGALARVPSAAPPALTATPDRLAPPVLPANPSLVERGSELYWRHCMPCHGDKGQGLTDEWRAVWVSDHQNCWARGCHAGRPGDEGFPMPRAVPAVAGASGALARFRTAGDLCAYLRRTQPPQEPGRLSDAEYRALAAYLLALNGRPPGVPTLGAWAALLAAGFGVAAAFIVYVRRKTGPPRNGIGDLIGPRR